MKVAAQFPNGAPPAELRTALGASGYNMTAFKANTGYFYTVLTRLVEKGRLERRRNGYYRVPAPTSSPQGETGAVAAPIPVSTH